MIRKKYKKLEECEVNKQQEIIERREEREKFENLGYLQAQGIYHKVVKGNVTNTYLKKVNAILNALLSSKNVSLAINSSPPQY